MILLCLYGAKDQCFILLPCHFLYSKPGGHKIVCTRVKFKNCFNVVKNHTNRFLLLYGFRKSIVWPIYDVYRFVNIEEKVKGQDFASTGVKYIKMLQWSQNAHLVNTIQIQNSLLYAACFVTMVMEWESQCPLAECGADRLCCVTIVTKHLTYGKLFWFLFLLDEHFETIAIKIGAFFHI